MATTTTTTDSVTVLRRCFVSPPSTSTVAASEFSLPLTFLDMIWLHFLPIERLMFYEIPQLSRAHFIDKIIPKLELSLSHTLGYFLPLAGNLIIPSSSSSSSSSILPEIRYVQGDSVALTIAECNKIDFSYLIENHARNCSDFHSLIPELMKPSLFDKDDSIWDSKKSAPVLAINVTLFPNFGISIGISNHHAVGDASTIFHFMKTWANLHSKLMEDNDGDASAELLVSESLPFYDRSIIKDTKGLASIYLERWNGILKFVKSNSSFSMDDFLNKKNFKVRQTFVFSRKDVEKLKNLASKKRGKMVHLSSFTVISAYVWTCLLKSQDKSGEEVSEEELEYFSFYAECRGRLDPPLPENYFGNCLTHCEMNSKHGKLVGEEGFQIAVELIGETIHERLKNNDSVFSDAEKWLGTSNSGKWKRDLGVAGSPRYNYYNMDFGWGKPRKFEFVSIDITGAISLNGCRESDGVVEVGISLSNPQMDAFTIVFKGGLNAL